MVTGDNKGTKVKKSKGPNVGILSARSYVCQQEIICSQMDK